MSTVSPDVPTKRCGRCRREMPLTDFWSDPRNLDGRVSRCRGCVIARRQELAAGLDPSERARRYQIRVDVTRRHRAKESARRAAQRSPGQDRLRKYPHYEGDLKVCQRCGIPQEVADFTKEQSRRDGRASWCRTCTRAATRDYRNRNWAQARETARAATRRYRQTPRGRMIDARNAGRRRALLLPPPTSDIVVKRRAHARVAAALRDGRLTRPDRCVQCGAPEGDSLATSLIGHHARGYVGPAALDVDWLCRPCHGKAHRVDIA